MFQAPKQFAHDAFVLAFLFESELQGLPTIFGQVFDTQGVKADVGDVEIGVFVQLDPKSVDTKIDVGEMGSFFKRREKFLEAFRICQRKRGSEPIEQKRGQHQGWKKANKNPDGQGYGFIETKKRKATSKADENKSITGGGEVRRFAQRLGECHDGRVPNGPVCVGLDDVHTRLMMLSCFINMA